MEYPKDKIEPNTEYYAFDFSADDSGQIHFGGQTQWVGWADSDCRVELREPSLVLADRLAELWTDLQWPFMVVNNVDEFVAWFLLGGHALVKESLATEVFADQLKAKACVQTGNKAFTSLAALPSTIFRPVPTPKQRMAILKRDDYRCRLCGRRPERHLDIELHVHHIRPHGSKGATHEDNLITLCDTCHRGLDPHYEWSLFNLLEDCGTDPKDQTRRKYLAGIKSYREARQRFLNELNALTET